MFTTGLLLGALLSVAVLWLLSGLFAPVPAVWREGVIVAAAVLAVLRDLGVLTVRLPQNARQIPQDVLKRDLVRGTLQFGFEMGTGVRTYVSASAPYALVVAVLLAGGGWAPALAAGLGFGLGRALTPALRLASGAAEEWDARLTVRLTAMKTVAAGAMAVAFAVLWAAGLS
ncbi:hypothetical protein SRB5_45870 [Streptomyces sp. RB5]|uniref:Uncharacterized protein n=1 Tax=Streptomyces smaragdinus TaxID=2585196 RepID=A0A7K0CLR4_9ACTN|nr:hypothetical protein [Streptomyces smaragdinus]MQY14420.1 hypothetical protein [Streptomyces smaragdinus]